MPIDRQTDRQTRYLSQLPRPYTKTMVINYMHVRAHFYIFPTPLLKTLHELKFHPSCKSTRGHWEQSKSCSCTSQRNLCTIPIFKPPSNPTSIKSLSMKSLCMNIYVSCIKRQQLGGYMYKTQITINTKCSPPFTLCIVYALCISFIIDQQKRIEVQILKQIIA